MTIEVLNIDCKEMIPYAHQFDVMITDPPYSAHVHASATSQSKGRGTRHRDLGFDHLSDELRAAVHACASAVQRWSIVYSDVESAHKLRDMGGYVRTMAWVRWSMPQLSGDRPPQGFEEVLVFWGQQKGPKSWNGPGNLTHLDHLAFRGEGKHKAEKPLDQMLDLVSWFTNPGDVVLDLFAGSGTTALACSLLGRSCVTTELSPEWCQSARDRIHGSRVSERDLTRVKRWLECDREPISALKEGPSVLRAQKRAEDKQRVRLHDMVRCVI